MDDRKLPGAVQFGVTSTLATGLLMINAACTAEQAEALLHQAAVADERTIVEIAQRIIRQHTSSRE